MQPDRRSEILFVDDDPLVLEAIVASLRRQRRVWNVRVARGVEAALGSLGRDPADAVVTDMRMPGRNGAELLRAVRERWPDAARFVMSGQADDELSRQALPLAHQWLAKPIATDALVASIGLALESMARLPVGGARRQVGALATFPAGREAMEALTKLLAGATPDVAAVVRVIGDDAGLTARLLQVANSALVGAASPVGSVGDALARVGVESVESLVLPLVEPTDGPVARRGGDLASDVGQLAARAMAPLSPGVEPEELGSVLLGIWGVQTRTIPTRS